MRHYGTRVGHREPVHRADRPALGGRLIRHLAELLNAPTGADNAAAHLACYHWLAPPEVIAKICDDPAPVAAEIARFRRVHAADAAPYIAEYRRATAEQRRALEALRRERAAPREQPPARGLSAFQRTTLVNARRARIAAAASSVYRRVWLRGHGSCAIPARSADLRRPRSGRSHPARREVKTASGDSGDDPLSEPPSPGNPHTATMGGGR